MNYKDNLIKIREKEGLTQQDLANILGIARVTYTHFETQYDIIPLKYLIKISNYFNISIDYILGLNTSKTYKIINKDGDIALFASRLKAFRKEHKLTQVKLASIIHTTHSTIAGYENQRCFIRTSFLYTICSKYNISADYLLGRTL